MSRGQTQTSTPAPERWRGRNYTSQQAARPQAPRRPQPSGSPPRSSPRPPPPPSGPSPAPEHYARARRAGAKSGQFENLRGRRALRCDGEGCCDRAVLAWLCSPRGPCVPSALPRQVWAFGCDCGSVLFYFFVDLRLRVRPEKGVRFRGAVPAFDSPRDGLKEGGGERRARRPLREGGCPCATGTTLGGGPPGRGGSRNWAEDTGGADRSGGGGWGLRRLGPSLRGTGPHPWR